MFNKIKMIAALIAFTPIIVRSYLMSPEKFQDWFYNGAR
jgi:hypothetical protein